MQCLGNNVVSGFMTHCLRRYSVADLHICTIILCVASRQTTLFFHTIGRVITIICGVRTVAMVKLPLSSVPYDWRKFCINCLSQTRPFVLILHAHIIFLITFQRRSRIYWDNHLVPSACSNSSHVALVTIPFP